MAFYPRGGGQKQFAEMAIPIVLVALVLVVVATQFMGICPSFLSFLCAGESVQTLIITNPSDYDAAKTFGTDISSRVTKITPVIDNNVQQHIRAGAITSNDYDLVILYGDSTALTTEARNEITDYVNSGGALIIVRGAGLNQMNTDGSISEYTFGWAVDDMAKIVKFEPACPSFTNCNTIGAVTVLPSDMSDVQFVPTQYKHQILTRAGITAPFKINIANYASFSGVTLVNEPYASNKVAWIEWTDGSGKGQSTAGFIAYDAGATGGRIVYLAYNPIELNQEDLFRNIINWATKAV
ncbi:MAG: hypothetical protein KAW41_05545 [Candidatus Diapherotrites archaeon]|nr:hypothetical protein [Candidatus Diapherotrites archaeon]